MQDLIDNLRAGQELTLPQIAECCRHLMDDDAPLEGRAELLAALHAKGETAAEIAGFVEVMLSHARRFEVGGDRPVIDLCGTGGDKQGLFNVSTAAMFVVAACGATVVKHGNRGITSKCGGADVLEALGVAIELSPERAAAVAADVGCVFLFAPVYHPAFRSIAPVRKVLAERGTPTVFNKLGPLLNPVTPAFQLAGVFDPGMVDVYAEVFRQLGRTRAWAVHGETPKGGLDEMSTLGATEVAEWDGADIRRRRVDAAEFGVAVPALADLLGGNAAENAAKLEALLRGRAASALEDIVCWNAAGALVVCGLAGDLGAGLERARGAIRDGGASARLDALRAG